MKNGKRPTRKQKMAIKAAGWDPQNWLVTKQPVGELHIQHRISGRSKVISA